MSIFSRKKSADFVQFEGNNSQLLTEVNVGNTLAHGAIVIAPPTHTALIIRNGSIADECTAGECPLYENDSRKAQHAVRTLKVIYISKTVKVTVKWGTQAHQRIEYVDPLLHKPVSVGAFGSMDVRVVDPKKFYLEMVANFGNDYSVTNLQEQIRARVVGDTFRQIGETLRAGKLSYVDFATAKSEMQDRIKSALADRFADYYGFTVCDFIIENINIPSEQEAEIKKLYADDSSYERDKVLFNRKREETRREKEAIAEDVKLDDIILQREYDKEDRQRIIAREQEDREWARKDAVADRTERMHMREVEAERDIEISRSQAMSGVAAAVLTPEQKTARHCAVCGATYAPSDLYCKSCGAAIPQANRTCKCKNCNADIPWGTAYCPICCTKTVVGGRNVDNGN